MTSSDALVNEKSARRPFNQGIQLNDIFLMVSFGKLWLHTPYHRAFDLDFAQTAFKRIEAHGFRMAISGACLQSNGERWTRSSQHRRPPASRIVNRYTRLFPIRMTQDRGETYPWLGLSATGPAYIGWTHMGEYKKRQALSSPIS